MSAKIVHAEVRLVALPLQLPFAISSAVMTTADNIFISIRSDNGYIGIGESAPFPVLTGDTSEGVYEALIQMVPQVLGKTTSEALELLLSEFWQSFSQFPSALVGLEMALLDLQFKEEMKSISSFFGSSNKTDAVTDITMPVLKKDDVAPFWKLFHSYDFEIVKVKVGGRSVFEDADCIEQLSQICSAKITLDGNQGCTIESALELLSLLEKRGIKPLFFEQPLGEKDFEGMAKLTRLSPVPICADETVKSVKDAQRVVNDSCAHFINLKITKSGIHETKKIIDVATTANIPLMIGGMLESEVAMCVSLHAACGSGRISYIDLDTPYFFKHHVTHASPWHAHKAKLVKPEGSGIGICLNHLVLDKYVIKECCFEV